MTAFQSDLEPVTHKEYVNIWGKNLFANKERKRKRQKNANLDCERGDDQNSFCLFGCCLCYIVNQTNSFQNQKKGRRSPLQKSEHRKPTKTKKNIKKFVSHHYIKKHLLG